jgi:hypothetical protein
MSRIPTLHQCAFLLLFCCTIVFPVGSSGAYQLTFSVPDTTVSRGCADGWLTVSGSNPLDSIAGLNLMLMLERPDLIRFDSVLDLNGTALADFDLVRSQMHSAGGGLIEIVAIAWTKLGPPPRTRGYAPSTVERPLFRIHFHALSVPDTMQNRTTGVWFSTFPDMTNFSTPQGATLGFSYQVYTDTAFFFCNQWQNGTCVDWRRVSFPPYDSTAIQLDSFIYVDTSKVRLTSGSVTVAPCTKRTTDDLDINNDGVSLAVSDYVALLRYIVGDTNGIGNPYAADFNGDCIINYADARKLDSLFKYGLWVFCGDFGPCYFPCACATVPVRNCCYGFRGNVNSDINNAVDLADLSALVLYLNGGPISFRCPEAANIDGSGIVNLGDLSRLVTYLTGTGSPLPGCP